MASQERINEVAPHGGVYSIAYYQDSDGKLVDKGKATRIEIVEYNGRDEAIWRTYGEIEPNP